VRNYDGLIALSDMRTGLWLFRMDGFKGWKGSDVGMPNISSVQDWDNGPDGARNASTGGAPGAKGHASRHASR
jgi:hypothetical protein